VNLPALLSRPYNSLFGYDIFISYAHRGSKDYAAKLHEQLISLDYSCFIDKKEVPGGRALTSSLKSALNASKTLILIGTERALTRDYVQLEFQEFVKTGRPIIPLNVEGALTARLTSPPWNVIRERDLVWIDETGEAVAHRLPSPEVYEGVQNLFQFTRRNVVRRRWTTAAVVLILGTAVLAIWQAQKATAQTRIAEAQTQIAENRKTELERQTKALVEERQNLATANDTLRQTNTALYAERKTALLNAEKARTQEALALANAEKAMRRQRSAESLYLSDYGRRVYETNPLLGLAFSLEALDRVPADDSSSRSAIERSLTDRIQLGRIARLDKNDFGQPYFLNAPFFVLSRPGLKGEIRSVKTGLAIETLDDEIKYVSGAEEDKKEDDYESDLPNTPPADIPYFVIHYKDKPGELRRRADASLVARGVVNVRYDPKLPFFLVNYGDATSELRRVDNDQVTVRLGNNRKVAALKFVEGASYFLIAYLQSPGEIRSVTTGDVLDRVDTGEGLWSVFSVSDDQSCYSVGGVPFNTSVPGGTRVSVSKLRCLKGDQPVGPQKTISRVFFSPFSHHYIVAYPDSRGELRTTNTNEVITLNGTVSNVVFNPADTHYVVLYSDAAGEIRQFDNQSAIEIPPKLTAIEANQGSPGFRATYDYGPVVLLNDGAGKLNQIPVSGFQTSQIPKFIIAKNAVSGAQEIHRTDTGTVLQLTGRYASANSFQYRDFPYIEVDDNRRSFHETLGLLHSVTGNLIALDDHPIFSPKHTLVYQSSFLPSTSTVYRVDTGQAIASFYREVYISPDETCLVAVNSDFGSDNGGVDQFVWTDKEKTPLKLNGKVQRVEFASDSSLVWIEYDAIFEFGDFHSNMELRRTKDGKVIATGRGLLFTYDGKYFIVTNKNDQSELWANEDTPRKLTELGTGFSDVDWETSLGRVLVWYSDKSAYILDLTWLSHIAQQRENLPDKLIKLSCEPFTEQVIDTLDLKPLVQSAPLRICRN